MVRAERWVLCMVCVRVDGKSRWRSFRAALSAPTSPRHVSQLPKRIRSLTGCITCFLSFL